MKKKSTKKALTPAQKRAMRAKFRRDVKVLSGANPTSLARKAESAGLRVDTAAAKKYATAMRAALRAYESAVMDARRNVVFGVG